MGCRNDDVQGGLSLGGRTTQSQFTQNNRIELSAPECYYPPGSPVEPGIGRIVGGRPSFTVKIHILSCYHTRDSEDMVNSVMAQSFTIDSFLLLLIVSSAGMNHQPHTKSLLVHIIKLKNLKNKKLISSKTSHATNHTKSAPDKLSMMSASLKLPRISNLTDMFGQSAYQTISHHQMTETTTKTALLLDGVI